MTHEIDLIDIYRMFQPKVTEHTFFSWAHGSFSKIDHMVEQKIRLNKIKKIEMMSSIFLDHNGLKLEIKLNKKTSKIFKYKEAKNTL